jgi:hypothetical protein
VINHGMLQPKSLAQVTMEEFKLSYEVNVFSYLAVVRGATGLLRTIKV